MGTASKTCFAAVMLLVACSHGSADVTIAPEASLPKCDLAPQLLPSGACGGGVGSCWTSVTDRCPDGHSIGPTREYRCDCRDSSWTCAETSSSLAICPPGDAGDDDGAIHPMDTGILDSSTDAAFDAASSAVDEFGVKKIYPTISAGREWYLPADPTVSDGEWTPHDLVKGPEPGSVTIMGSPRIDVVSPKGKAWWRNVEITAYLRYGKVDTTDPSQQPHWTFYARGERHTTKTTADPSTINGGVSAPTGTAVWPGYPYAGLSSIDARCLGTSLKGFMWPDGRVEWKKEISHTAGYTAGLGIKTAVAGGVIKSGWFGFKVVIRNVDADKHVHLESYVDADASGAWVKATEVDDLGAWNAQAPPSGTALLDGCDAAPFGYKNDTVITWAGPNVTFRVDNLDYDFKWASAREIAPLP